MAETFMVQFTDVGARKVSWKEALPRPVDENQIVAAVRRRGVLCSRGIDAEFDNENEGTILVGGFRAVGKFSVQRG